MESESLSSRIAQLVAGKPTKSVGDAFALADAVIAALGLREEREDVASFQPGEIDDSMMPPRQKGRLAWTPSHRYVTEWTPDE
jgi:hypothetical protein